MRAYDGRGSRTALTEGVLTAWELLEPEALVRRVYQEGIGPTEIAGLAPIVDQAAAAGDAAARVIVGAAGAELALALQSVARQLALTGPVPCRAGRRRDCRRPDGADGPVGRRDDPRPDPQAGQPGIRAGPGRRPARRGTYIG